MTNLKPIEHATLERFLTQLFNGSRDPLIKEKIAAELLDISPDTLRRLGRRGEGPRRRKISPRRVGYKLSEVEAYRDRVQPSLSEAFI
jgi:predicted DNA-binding transcriptional regulator AlpA